MIISLDEINIPKNPFEALVKRTEASCEDILRKAGLPHWKKEVRVSSDGEWTDDPLELSKAAESIHHVIGILEFQDRMNSQEWYAAIILEEINEVRIILAINDDTYNDAASAASKAMSLGANIAAAGFKFAWEDDVVLGRTVRQESREAAKKSAQIRGEKKQENRTLWRTEADCLLNDHPNWVMADVVRHLADKYDKNETTVRKELINPKEWSTVPRFHRIFRPRKQKS